MKKLYDLIMAFFVGLFFSCSLSRPATSVLGKQLCNSTVLTNQFSQSNTVGVLDLITNPNPAILTGRFYDAVATTTLVAGEGIKLTDLGASDSIGPPIVAKRTADADAIFGVRVYSTKNGASAVNDRIQIAGQGAVILMEASAAIARGAQVALVLATAGQVVTRTTEEIFGLALDKASASGDLIRVFITARGFAELLLYNLP